jgi:hypothetical protein
MKMAVAIKPGDWVTENDFPPEAYRQDKSGLTVARLLVDTTGRPQSCSLISKGRADFDARACPALMAHGKFEPAADDDGIYAAYIAHVRWRPESRFAPNYQYILPPDIEITLNHMPKGAPPSIYPTAMIRFDEKGVVSKCVIIPPTPSAELDALACRQASALPPQTPIVDHDGHPTPWLTTVSIHFQTALAPKKRPRLRLDEGSQPAN